MNKILLALSLLSAPTIAADQTIYLGGWSKHLNGNADNETHRFHAYCGALRCVYGVSSSTNGGLLGSAVFFTVRYEWWCLFKIVVAYCATL